MIWEELKEIALNNLNSKNKDQVYIDRLKFEFSEIEKQGYETYWINLYIENRKFSSNPSMLVLPWLLGMVDIDPIATRTEPLLNNASYTQVHKFLDQYGNLPSDFTKDMDMPDIDIDCLPEARDDIKKYAATRFNIDINDEYGNVCNVGTWQTYKFKSALLDVARAIGKVHQSEIHALTTTLPEDVDDLREFGQSTCKGKYKEVDSEEEKECKFVHAELKCPRCGSDEYDNITIGRALFEYQQLQAFKDNHPDLFEYAIKMIGKVRNAGVHAGAIVIANKPLFGNVPLTRSSNKNPWSTMWPEGRNTHLSKLGYCKLDILGLKTLEYIYSACRLIKENRGISFGPIVKKYAVKLKNGEILLLNHGDKILYNGQEVDVQDVLKKF